MRYCWRLAMCDQAFLSLLSKIKPRWKNHYTQQKWTTTGVRLWISWWLRGKSLNISTRTQSITLTMFNQSRSTTCLSSGGECKKWRTRWRMLNEQKNQNKNQIYLLIIDTMWIHCLIIYFVVSIVIFIINLFELLILIKKTKGKKELWLDIETDKFRIIIGYISLFFRPISVLIWFYSHISDLFFIFWNDKKAK